MDSINYKRSKTTEFFYKINLIAYLSGFPNCWIEEFTLFRRFVKIYNSIIVIKELAILTWILFQCGAFFTQTNIIKKQRYKLLQNTISYTIVYCYYFVVWHHKNTIKTLFYNLAVVLKRFHNDHKIEKHMIKTSKKYIGAFFLSCLLSIIMYTFDAYMDMVRNGATFTTILTAYPNVTDHSNLANTVRAIFYFLWWIFLLRGLAAYILVLSLTISLSHQYQNLQSYFHSLKEIFEKDNLTKQEKENQYVKLFKVGIQLHSDTLWCTKQCQSVCGVIFSGQIIMNVMVLIVIMVQMVDNAESNLTDSCAALITATAILISTGFFMWNAGDVTVEASRLPTAIYSSGWENCQGQSSTRIRKLVTITLNYAQKPVVLKGFGYIELSYQSYLQIVKLSYSVFSVLV